MQQAEMQTVPVKSYPAAWRWIHWLTAIVVLSLIPAGLVMTRMPEGPAQDQIFSLHKSFGLLVLALTIIRLTWKVTQGGPPAVATLTPFERIASHSAHGLLYILLLAVPFGGWLGLSAYGFPPSFFGLFTLPALLAKSEPLAGKIFTAHFIGALAIGAIALVHIAGAVSHLRRGDGVFARMWPRK